jgi:hypothetical protein
VIRDQTLPLNNGVLQSSSISRRVVIDSQYQLRPHAKKSPGYMRGSHLEINLNTVFILHGLT